VTRLLTPLFNNIGEGGLGDAAFLNAWLVRNKRAESGSANVGGPKEEA
jgi:hypothetical protein